MKTLVIQLARLGDIYQTWPVVRSLKRNHPDETFDLLVRERFAGAAEGLAVDGLLKMPSASILSSLLDRGEQGIDEATLRMSEFVDTLRGYDRVINLSFSPLSSYLTHWLEVQGAQVSGYTRHSDGFLNLPDDNSAYFYAQVGVGRSNRAHLTDIFAAIAGVELSSVDFWGESTLPQQRDESVVLHVGASSDIKSLTASQWRQVLVRVRELGEWPIVLVGGPSEVSLTREILEGPQIRGVTNMVGQTGLPELWQLIARSRLLLGCDSSPVQIASLTNTPVLNISFSTVNFWETGPRSQGSRVLLFTTKKSVVPKRIATELRAMLDGTDSGLPIIRRLDNHLIGYEVIGYKVDDFDWHMIQALYMEGDFPPPGSELFLSGCERLAEVALLAIEQIDALLSAGDKKISIEILNQVDLLIKQIENFCPPLQTVIRWFETERVRMGPGPMAETAKNSRDLFEKLFIVLSIYVNDSKLAGEVHADNQIIQCGANEEV